MNTKEIILSNKFCYPCYPVIEKEFIYIGLRFTDKDSDINSVKSYQIQKINSKSNNVIWSIDLVDNKVLCKPIIVNDIILFSTESGLIAVNKLDGKQVWKFKTKIWTSHLSYINDKIYLINKNAIEVIDIKSGKRLKQKKYRIKWIDSPVVTNNNKLFISTSNCKILEIDKDSLEILTQYKYPGSWAIATTPEFYKNQILSNSYASYITSFDIDSGNIIWRIKKKAGSEPKQLIASNFLYAIEILGAHKLTSINLSKGKKIWSKDYHIHELIDYKENTLLATLKQENGQYTIGLISKKNGELIDSLSPNNFKFDDKFQYRLWNEALIENNDEKSIICYKPNEITILTK
ncbi:PQQ-binding-like beta-propeller repeat protein [Tenacibaculum aiptasiae]|uniref:outer membrane protein assembly factor BamB family protein n=1 Tax=Tenacibaculum aiptasiae TaxID=426481 RepID=UPI00232CA998|nr:PQQ-binding-like beta-propeller repeat protein [Tenacibaculum aiptasiae]